MHILPTGLMYVCVSGTCCLTYDPSKGVGYPVGVAIVELYVGGYVLRPGIKLERSENTCYAHFVENCHPLKIDNRAG